jgi:aconitate hydratase
VLSGNRNFEGRIHPLVKSSYLASPPLVVAYALAGTVATDLSRQPLGTDPDGRPVFLKDIWPTQDEVNDVMGTAITKEMYTTEYGKILEGDRYWKTMPSPTGAMFAWDPASTYVQEPPFFKNLGEAKDVADVVDARVLVMVGDSVTTDHISPAGSFPPSSPAGEYLQALGVNPVDFNQYGTRRGNHEVLIRGTFANIRLRNQLVQREGWWTRHVPSGEEMPIYDAAQRYKKEGTPLGLTGDEAFTIRGLASLAPRAVLDVKAKRPNGEIVRFKATARVADPVDLDYLRHGGVLPMVFRELLATS